MAERMIGGRAFEQSLLQRQDQKEATRKYYYERLMQVIVRHTYYPGPDFACPDFKVIPAPDSTTLMKDLGLLFLEEPYGFSVIYDLTRKDDLFDYLRRQSLKGRLSPAPLEPEVWTRISVVLALKNMSFTNFTKIPIDTDPLLKNFYFSNQDAHQAGKNILLAPGNAVGPKELEKVIPPQYAISIDNPEVTAITVRDVSHHVVMCRPRCIPRGLAKVQNANTVTCQDVREFRAACREDCLEECLKQFPDDPVARRKCEKNCFRKYQEQVCVDTIFLDFSQLPEGRYSIEQVKEDPDTLVERVISMEVVLYTISGPAPLCFIDLFLTDPMPGITENGIYPVRNLFDDKHAEIVNVRYELKFLARATRWNYFIIPQPPRELDDLSIRSETGPEFVGPCPVILANGAPAYRFLSEKAIPLQKRSRASFQLYSDETLIEQRLPVASTQVLPRSRATACLDLLTSLANRPDGFPPCRQLRDHLCPECKGRTIQQCIEKVQARSRSPGDNPVPEPFRNYSDIFVYI